MKIMTIVIDEEKRIVYVDGKKVIPPAEVEMAVLVFLEESDMD